MDSRKPNFSVEKITNACDWERDFKGCEELNGQKIIIEGELYYPDTERYFLRLFPVGTAIPTDGNDELWDKVSTEEVYLRFISNNNLSVRETFHKKHQKTVLVSGTISSECITIGREIAEEMELNKDIIIMSTGFCHSPGGVYISNIKLLN